MPQPIKRQLCLGKRRIYSGMTANTEEKKFFEKNQIKFPKQYLLENGKMDCNNTRKIYMCFR